MKNLLPAVMLSVCLVFVGVTPAAGAPPPDAMEPPSENCKKSCREVTGGGAKGTVEILGKEVSSDHVPGRGGPAGSGSAPGRNEYEIVEEALAPACRENQRGDDLLCLAALSCPTPEQVRYWIWHRVTRVTVEPPSRQVGAWSQEEGSFCLGPDDPGVPTIGKVIAQVRLDFQSLPLPAFPVRADPAPQTLVNIPTAFSAGTAEPMTFSPTILGAQVSITARPTRWDWTFGDGATLATTVPGTPRQPEVAHTYRRAQEFAASVRVTWTGTFTVEGSTEVFDIQTPVFVQSPQTVVAVRQARTELVSR